MDSVERIVKAASSGSQIMVPEGVRGFVVVKRNNGTNVIELVLPKDSFKIDNFLRNHCDPEVYASLRREKRELDEWRGNEEDIDFGGSSPKPIDGNRTDLICSPRHIAFALDYMAKRPGSTVYQAARFLFDSFGVRVTVEQLENGIAAMNKSKDSGDSDKPKVEVPKVIETKESTIGIESEDHKDTVARLISGERARYSRGQQAETTTSADVVLVGEPPASSASGTTTAGGDLQLEPPKTEDLAIGTPAAIMKKRVIRIVQYRDEISEFIASRIAGGKACYTWDIAAMLLERHGIAIPAKNVSQTMAKWREDGNPHKIPTLTHWDPNKDRDGEPKERERFWRDKSEEIKRFIQEHQKVGNRVTCVEIAWMLMEKYKRPISTRSVMNVLVDYRIADPEFPFLYHLNKNRKTPRREGNYGFWAEHKDEILELVAANPERNYADLAGIMEAKFGRSISADALGTVLGRWRRGIRLTRLKRPKVGTARTKRIRKKRTRNDSKEVAEGRKSIVLSQREAVRACLDDIAELMNRPEGCRRGDIIELVRAKTGVSVTRKNMGVVLAVIRTEQRMAGKPVLPKIKLHDSTGQTNGGDIRPEIEIQKPRTQPIDVITVDIDPNAGITGNKAGIIAFVGIVTRIWGGCSTHDIVRMLGRYGINTTPKSIGNRISLWRRTDPNIPSLKDRRRAQKVAAIPAETVTHQKTELSKEHKDEKYQQIKEIVWIGGKTGNSLLEISLRLAQSQEVVLTADEIVALMKEVGVFEEWLEQIRKRETSLMHGFAIRGLDGRAEIEKLGGHIAQHDDKVEWIPKNDDNPKLGRADQTDQENVATTEQSKKHGFWRRIRENIRTFIEERHGKGERCSNQEIADWIYRNHSRKVSRHSVENALSSYRKDDKTFPNLHCMKNNAPYVKIAKSDKKDEIPERDTRSDGQRTMREAKERVLDLLNKADAEGKYPTHTDIVEVLRSEGVRIASVGAFNEMLTRWRKEGGDDAKERIPKRMHGMGVRRKNT